MSHLRPYIMIEDVVVGKLIRDQCAGGKQRVSEEVERGSRHSVIAIAARNSDTKVNGKESFIK